ncbi:MAG: hypothetical protein ACPLRU_01760, partial [Desulfofundulus sp.]
MGQREYYYASFLARLRTRLRTRRRSSSNSAFFTGSGLAASAPTVSSNVPLPLIIVIAEVYNPLF